MPRLSLWPLLLVAVLHSLSPAQNKPRFEARFTDGTWIEGNQLANWYSTRGTPQLEGRKLLDATNPFRWLRDRSQFPQRRPTTFVETTTGDLIPGQVLAYHPGGSVNYQAQPPHLVVQPAFAMRPRKPQLEPRIRVGSQWVRRIVWKQKSNRYRPGTVVFRDGRSIAFRSARFVSEGVRLLTRRGAKTHTFQEMAELHLPRTDTWNAILDELAVLDSTAQSRLLQYEATSGLRVTTSLNRVTPIGSGNDLTNWVHGIQPAWSLDVLWIPNGDIWMRRSFPAHEVPLSRIPPSHSRSRSMISAAAIPFQTNRSVLNRALQSGGHDYGWGIGVHALSDLRWELPSFVTAFRTSIGLDRSAGPRGGCVKAKISLQQGQQERTLYASPFLVGAAKVTDSPRLTLPPAPATGGKKALPRRTLRLVVDPAHQGRPQDADPFDIRDMTSWLAPTLELDRDFLRKELPKRLPRQDPAWNDWVVQMHRSSAFGAAATPSGQWKLDSTANPLEAYRFHWNVQQQFWSLAAERSLQNQPKWILIQATRQPSGGTAPRLQIRFNNELVSEQAIPPQSPTPAPIAVPLHRLNLRQHQTLSVELSLLAANTTSTVQWYDIALTRQSPRLLELLQDDGNVALVPQRTPGDGAGNEANAEWQKVDRYSGSRAVKLLARKTYRLDVPAVAIRGTPQLGEYRYLRMAFRKRGAGRLGIRLRHADELVRPTNYDAGRGAVVLPKAVRIAAALPDEWTVVTRDLYSDFGQFDLTSLEFQIPDGHSLLLDHVYLAPDTAALGDVPVPRFDPVAKAGRQSTIDKLRKNIAAAVARVRLPDGTNVCGVCIGSNGELLAPAAPLAEQKVVKVVFASGQQFDARVNGIDRHTNSALLQISRPPKSKPLGLPTVSIKALPQFSASQPLISASVDGGAATPRVRVEGRDWMFAARNICCLSSPSQPSIGPLFDASGALVGMTVGPSQFQGTRFVALNDIAKRLPSLRQLKRVGQWVEGAEPRTGFSVRLSRLGCTVHNVRQKSSSFRAGDVIIKLDETNITNPRAWFTTLSRLDPGARPKVAVRRNNKVQSIPLRLSPANFKR